MIFPSDPTHLPRHPSQLYEAVGEGIIVAAIVWWVDARSHAGFILGSLSMGQLLCLAMIICGAAVAVSTRRRRGEPFAG